MSNFLYINLFVVFLKSTVGNEMGRAQDFFASPLNVEVMADRVTANENFQWLESPLWSEAGQYLLFSDVKWEKNGLTPGMIWRWDATNGVTRFLEGAGIVGPPSVWGFGENITGLIEGGPNGLEWGWNGDGDLLICQHGKRRIARVDVADVMNGMVAADKVTVVANSFDGKPFNSPNDLSLLNDGSLYFSDPAFGLQYSGDTGLSEAYSRMTQPPRVYQTMQGFNSSASMAVVNTGFNSYPNGVAFSSAGNMFVAMTNSSDPHFRMYTDTFKETPPILVKLPSMYRINRTVRDIAFNLNDGITTYKDIIFGAGPGGVYILNGTTGIEVGFVRLDALLSNVCVGGGYLWITANQRLLRIKLKDDTNIGSDIGSDIGSSIGSNIGSSTDPNDSSASNITLNYFLVFLLLARGSVYFLLK